VTSSVKQRAAYDPIYDINPATGVCIEVFYSDRTLETFGKCGSGWFWWPRSSGYSPEGPPTGPFPTCYAAYRHAVGTRLGTSRDCPDNLQIGSDG
jgi:hypothetical protein